MKHQRTFFLLFLANSISGFAQGISMLAVPWYFTDMLNQGNLFGKVFSGITLISIVWIFIAGNLIDRYSRKKIFLYMNLVGGIVLGSVSASGYILGMVPQGLALTAFGVTMMIFNIHYPTLYSFGQEISEKSYYSKINSYIEIQGQATSILSGGMAAILLAGSKGGNVNIFGYHTHIPLEIEPWSLHRIFLMDAITYVLAFIIIAMIKYSPKDRQIDLSPLFKRLQSGFLLLRSRPALFIFGISTLSILVVTMVHEYYLLAQYVSRHLHAKAEVYGSAQLFYALGAVASGFMIRKIFINTHHPVAVIILLGIASIMITGLYFNNTIGYVFLFAIIFGLCNAGSRIIRITYIFHEVPNTMIGRVNSIFSISHTFERSIFAYLFSLPFFVNDNVTYAYLIFAIFLLVSASIMFTVRNKLPVISA